jgi:hypothetical protein
VLPSRVLGLLHGFPGVWGARCAAVGAWRHAADCERKQQQQESEGARSLRSSNGGERERGDVRRSEGDE